MRLFTDVSSRIEDPMMRRAYELAERGRGTTSPNPVVGCVIAQDDEVVGEGFHQRAGGPHAEVVALAQAGPRAAGATAYVTLEPCNHFGRTPPCADALVTRGIARVIIGMLDPNPVAVGGHVRLREAGVEVEFVRDPTPFEIQNEAWLHHVRTGRPFVQVKVALSLDGHPAAADGGRLRITGTGGREVTMRLRAAADAVLVGASTARADDPALTVRDLDGTPAPRQPLRVVAGRQGVPDANLFHDGLGETAALVPHGVAEVPDGVSAVTYDAGGGLDAALRALGDVGVRRVLVEAGPRMLSALWEADLIDSLVVVHAGGMLGPVAEAAFAGRGDLEGGRLLPRMAPIETGIVGTDVVTVWQPSPRVRNNTAAAAKGLETCSRD